LQETVLEVISQYGYLGVFLLIALENIFPPIPSEVILTFAGFMTTVTPLKVGGVIIAATLGSLLGAVILYSLGRLLHVDRLEAFIAGPAGQALRLKREDVRLAEGWFRRYGYPTVFFCRFVPIVRSLISVPAGMAKMKVPVFLVLTTLGTSLWNIVLVYLGRAAGQAWEKVARYFDTYSTAALILFILLALAAVAWFVKKRFLEQ